MTISDDILSAFLDGELKPAEAERIEILITRDGELARRVERLRLAGELAREAYAPLAAAAAPRALRAAAGVKQEWPRFATPFAAALAACAAGVVLGVSVRGEGPGRLFAFDGGLTAAPLLSRALNDTMSGDELRSGAAIVTPIYSFRDSEGHACRVFRVRAEDVAIEGAACRDAGAWRIAALAPARATNSAFVQARSGEPAAIAAAVDALWSEEIAPSQERAEIVRRWAVE